MYFDIDINMQFIYINIYMCTCIYMHIHTHSHPHICRSSLPPFAGDPLKPLFENKATTASEEVLTLLIPLLIPPHHHGLPFPFIIMVYHPYVHFLSSSFTTLYELPFTLITTICVDELPPPSPPSFGQRPLILPLLSLSSVIGQPYHLSLHLSLANKLSFSPLPPYD
jgi:hypothetical protein